MKEWIVVATEQVILIIDMLAMMVIVAGTIQAVVGGLSIAFRSPSGRESREVWIRYARWLVAGLTFQLAADIIESSITVGWDAVGRLAAIAVIRTFLNYFLDHDLAEIRERQHVQPENAPSPTIR